MTASASTTHRVTAFGLTVASEIAIPELPETDSPNRPDVVVSRGTVDRPANVAEDRTIYYRSPDEQLLLYEVANVSIRNGREIVVDPEPDVPGEILRHLVIGPALNYLLRQRGYFVLHASTVAIDEEAVAFVGESGVGKTTTAMAFLLAGERVLSDDVAAIKPTANEPRVRGGYPSIKLDPTLVDRLDVPVDPPQSITPARDRHFHGVRHEMPESTLPLKRIYLLEDADRESVLPVDPQDRIFELVRNTYTVGLLGEIGRAETNFRQCASLAESVPIKRLRRRRTLETLGRVVDLVREYLDESR